ncbi:hypothetical protein FB45DRAFT_1034466 [Roridomyces roridus]|uniref:Uncharacterized protein n=1 Tax=Roridomyces roridus TaxID=1738132 RepID=A0AAD7FDB6_9AGAR|nr:hypothetical protein FB45DRAFT_1034466 [Roridomyces roridus]
MTATQNSLSRPLRKLFRRTTTTNPYPNLKHLTVFKRARPHRILPSEVWDSILADLSDDFLLLAAGVCSTFNERCIVEYLHRHGVSRQDLRSHSTLTLPADLLPVFALSVQTMPQAHTLVCTFLAFHDVPRELRYLQQFISRADAGQVQQLDLRFDGNVLGTNTPYSQQELLTELEGVLKAIVGKTPGGPVAVLDGSDIHLVGPRFSLASVKADPTTCRLVWEHKTRLLLRDITSIHCSVAGLGTSQPFTLIVFNHQAEPTVRFGAKFRTQQTELNALLPHINFPGALARVRIAALVNPAVLASFVTRHPTIQFIHSELSSKLPPRRLLTEPLALPSLTQIESKHVAHLPALMEAFGGAPLLETISLPIHRRTPGEVVVLTEALRGLATLPGGELRMSLCAWDIGRHAWEPITEAEREVVESLDRITAVSIEADSVGDVMCQLPWLAMLPALESVKVRIFERWASAGEVRAALPGVAEIEVVQR